LIDSIHAVNFQSLRNVELEFGKFTVIVGASSSGKSAVTRAIKAVTSNALNSDYITRGAKKSSVSLKVEEFIVTIERESGDSSVYKVVEAGREKPRFARLNRQVPAQVTEALGIAPSTKEVASINFAGQFDAPYLLTEGASSVATVLGELTNVSTIFAAVKEANRRAKAASSLINLRKKDEAQLVEDLKKFANIGKAAKDITAAEQIMAECIALENQIEALQSLAQRLDAAEKARDRFVENVTLPDLEPLLAAQETFNRYTALLRSVASSQKASQHNSNLLIQANDALIQAEAQLHELLVSSGTCPTCNQEIIR
jgi:chromosome segregation ATPase